MREQLLKAMQRNQIVNMMYMSKSGEITKRRVKLVKINDFYVKRKKPLI